LKPVGYDRLWASPPLEQDCSEQGKRPTAKEFKPAERDKQMSEQQKSFMQQLDLWIEANIIGPLCEVDVSEGDWGGTVERIERAVRTKMMDSYRNGQEAGL
jgi:hypothetical protein